MKQYKICVFLFTLISLNNAAVVGPNFGHARQLITQTSRPINYDQFCSKKLARGDKIACLIKDEPTVGLLVCKAATLGGESCEDAINDEIQVLRNISDDVKTVAIDTVPISGLNCGVNPAQVCSGFLEEWVHDGPFMHVRDAITQKRIPALIGEVNRFTATGREETVGDLESIKMYMEGKAPNYRQICDLQGFFLKNGGFKVTDVPCTAENIGLDDRCWDDSKEHEPTTQEVLDTLDLLISGLQ
ncbi:uncharacterized protein LOC144652130 [Oculina patagonica]